jgi:hypothetical protein
MEWNVVWFVGSLAGGLLASAIGVEWVRVSRSNSDPEQERKDHEREEEQAARMQQLAQLARACRPYCPSCDYQRAKELQRRALEAEEAMRRRSARNARLRAPFAWRGPSSAMGRNA